MNISNNISSIQSNQSYMNVSASSVARSGSDANVDLAKEMPKQIVAENVNSANVSAIKSQDEMFGSLLDIKA